MPFKPQNKNMHSLGVGISIVFEVFGHFLYQGGQDHSVWLLTSHQHLLLDTRNKNIYGLDVGIATYIFYIWALPVSGGWDQTVWS
jgi:hypothetical protein